MYHEKKSSIFKSRPREREGKRFFMNLLNFKRRVKLKYTKRRVNSSWTTGEAGGDRARGNSFTIV